MHNAATNICNVFNCSLASVLCLFVTHLFQVTLIKACQSLAQLSPDEPCCVRRGGRPQTKKEKSFSNNWASSPSPSLLHSAA